MWVLDEPVVQVLDKMDDETNPSNFFILMLGMLSSSSSKDESSVQPSVQNAKYKNNLKWCVFFAKRKLLPSPQDRSNDGQLDLSKFAVLATRLYLDLDFVYFP